jgi:hypothetical protein
LASSIVGVTATYATASSNGSGAVEARGCPSAAPALLLGSGAAASEESRM